MGKKRTRTFLFIEGCCRFFYHKMDLVGTEHIPPGGAVLVGNHAQVHGPAALELYAPPPAYIWCAGEMMHRETIPAYAYEDFWGSKKHFKWFYKLLSHLIVPLALCLLNNADTIGIYRDLRLRNTFRETVQRLEEGANIVIFPEHNVKYNHIVYDFQDRFIDVARHYHRKTGKELAFVPMYTCPALRKIVFGPPVYFRSGAPMKEERERIRLALMEGVTEIAVALPEHTVIPYKNIGRKNYPKNK